MPILAHRNIVHCRETADDGVFLVADTYHRSDLGGYKEMSCSQLIIEAAHRGFTRKYLELKG